jgi:sulfur carrier protein ThiS
MTVTVNLFTILKKYGKGKIGENGGVDLPDEAMIRELLSYLDIPDKKGKIILVNGMPRDEEYRLNEGDVVKILSFIGGG